jgi:hypothetical protein
MMQRVYVRVVGFSNVERHALNTVFRLSQDRRSAREWSYEPWALGSPAAPRLALIDGASPDAGEALADIEQLGGIGIIWVGAISPAKAWRSFQRPMSWPTVLACMDEYFTPGENRVDVDFGHDTWPSVLESTGAHMFPELDLRRVLLADPDGDSRMYLRTKLSSFGITQIYEASNVLEATDYVSTELTDHVGYNMLVVDLDLPGGDPWSVLAKASFSRLKLLTRHRLSFANRITAKVHGYHAMSKPFDPSRLNDLLAKVL